MELTEQQARQIAANAVNASAPMGVGIMAFDDKVYSPDDVQQCVSDRGINIDYFDGRMVKLYIRRDGDDWILPTHSPRHDYQSWVTTYPTYEALFQSAL